MFSIEKCRTLLDDRTISDEEVEALRDAFYDSAQLAFEVYWSDKSSGSKNPLGLLRDTNPADIV